jgi:hypothetical protein
MYENLRKNKTHKFSALKFECALTSYSSSSSSSSLSETAAAARKEAISSQQ